MNKYQQALNQWIEDTDRCIGDKLVNDNHEEINILQELVDKATPTKPNIWGDGIDSDGEIIYDMYDCPYCHKSYEIDYEKYKYCPNCGQCLDWGDIDE